MSLFQTRYITIQVKPNDLNHDHHTNKRTAIGFQFQVKSTDIRVLDVKKDVIVPSKLENTTKSKNILLEDLFILPNKNALGHIFNAYPSPTLIRIENLTAFDIIWSIESTVMNVTNLTFSLNIFYDDDSVSSNTWLLRVAVIPPQRLIDKLFYIILPILIIFISIQMGILLDTTILIGLVKNPKPVIIGFLAQYGLMPFLAMAIAKIFRYSPLYSLALFVIGCCPGSGASNQWTILFDGDVNLSALMSFVSTAASFVMMPLYFYTIGRIYMAELSITVPFLGLCRSLALVVIPYGLGIFISYRSSKIHKIVKNLVKPMMLFLLLFFLIFGSIVNWYLIVTIDLYTALTAPLLPYLGFILGAAIAWVFGLNWCHIKTVGIEAGIQNTGIAFMIMFYSFPQPYASQAIVVPLVVAFLTTKPFWVAYVIRNQIIKYKKRQSKNPKQALPSEVDDKINPNMDTNTERQTIHTKLKNRPNSISLSVSSAELSEKKQLELIGLQLRPKTSSNTTDIQLIITNSKSSIASKVKVTKVDYPMLHLSRRIPWLAKRKVPENISNSISDKLNTISSNRRTNTTIQSSDDKSTMTQRPSTNLTLNSSITILKKLTKPSNQISQRLSRKAQHSFVTLGRDTTPIKLPTLLKRTSSTIIKPIPSAYIQDSSQHQISSSSFTNRSVLQPTPVLPIYAPHHSVTLYTEQQHLPLIKDRIIKSNLSQRANLKCKSPLPYRSDSSLSRSTTAVITATQVATKTHNPLKHMDVGFLLNEAARNRLKRLFQQLDTDRDGHLTYPQVQKCLPSNLPRAQETFFRVLYDITIDSTFFGLQEFYATAVLVDMVAKQDPELWNKLLDDVDFNYYHDDLIELLDEFDNRYSPVTSTINFDNLVGLIMHRAANGKYERVAKELESRIPMIKTLKFTRLDFIALIPLIIYIESCLDHGKPLFRFEENSILNLHMQKALLA
ncbi:unnamed protein product [Rotaria socialis]|uniref:EF-hand domain-containing protein n=1 Tax=Rotaria socialis TaxID=392032 RepID=A0A820JD30_9BILA|nr:unnamed protein product [Rotaria socialis]